MVAENRLGLLERRCPARDWPDAGTVDFRPIKLPRLTIQDEPEVEEIRRGLFRPFDSAPRALSFPPNWSLNVLTGEDLSSQLHWSKIPDFGSGDIKGVWELSRWAWAYPLGRAYLRTRDEHLTETFLTLANDWLDKNPPNIGPNWKCGQEASIRLMAAAWALSAFSESPLVTESIRARFAALAAVTAQRVEAHLSYAISQDNNHAISELVGLLVVGSLWPQLPQAAARREKSRKFLAKTCNRLFASDGSFSQHSSNYHRVALDGLCLAAAVSKISGESLPPQVVSAAKRGGDFLHSISDTKGRVARYGADDGARILPLAAADYGDYRPTLAACSAIFDSKPIPEGVHQDQARLLGFQARLSNSNVLLAASDLREGGIHVRRQGDSMVSFRCPTQFRFRPSHADQLHLSILGPDDFTINDPGSLSYNLPGVDWASLVFARFHNVPLVDDGDPMERVSRFLWLPWTTCRLEDCTQNRLVASHQGFKGFTVRREITLVKKEITVTDSFEGNRDADLSVRWNSPLKADLERLAITSDQSFCEEWHESDHKTGLGINCLRYGSPGPGWLRIARIKCRMGKIVTRIPFVSKAKD
jgi:hypothetical protein